eukprot:767883-Pleurochrysis_carterae.AAC.1
MSMDKNHTGGGEEPCVDPVAKHKSERTQAQCSHRARGQRDWRQLRVLKRKTAHERRDRVHKSCAQQAHRERDARATAKVPSGRPTQSVCRTRRRALNVGTQRL